MCYSGWNRKSADIEAIEKARKEAEELTRRAMKPRPAAGLAAPRAPEKSAEGKPEPAKSA